MRLLCELESDSARDGPQNDPVHYSGALAKVPAITSGISRLLVGVLRAILSHHGIPIHGVKDELVL